MTKEQLFLAIGGCSDDLLEACTQARHIRRPHRLLAAACVLLVLLGSFGTALRLGYFRAGCGGWPGTIVDGTYYFTVRHKGACSYTPGGTPEKVRGAFWMDGWLVNDYGFYYTLGRSLYVRPLDGGKTTRLYTANLLTCSHIGFDLEEDGNVVLTLYNKWAEYKTKLLLDGRTGKVLETLLDRLPYSAEEPIEQTYTIGDRTVILRGTVFGDRQLLENGESLLPEGARVESRPHWIGDGLLVRWWQGEEEGFAGQVLLMPEGDHLIQDTAHSWWDGADGYLYTVDNEGNVLCYALDTDQVFTLPRDAERDVYELETDGAYLYTTAPWADGQVCWHIETDAAGRPVGLTHVADFG